MRERRRLLPNKGVAVEAGLFARARRNPVATDPWAGGKHLLIMDFPDFGGRPRSKITGPIRHTVPPR